MTKKEMALKISKDAGITVRQAEKALSSMLVGVADSLRKGKRVTFSGFGSFEVKTSKARKGKNPRTGDSIQIPKKKRVKFNPSQILKDSL